MFASRRNSAYGPIGLDVGTHSIKMLQCLKRGQGWAVHAAAAVTLPAGLPEEGQERTEALARIIRQMRAGGGFVGKQVVSCLPCSAVHYKNLRLPKMPPEEVRAAVGWEAADRFKMGPDAIQVQYFDAGEIQQGQEKRQEIIVLAATAETVDKHLDLLLRSDLKPEAIDAAPGALTRVLVGSGGAAGTPRMLVDVGYSASKILIVHQDQVAFFKAIETGGQRLDQMVAQTLSMSLADAAGLRRRLQSQLPGAGGDLPAEAAHFGTPRENIERAITEAVHAVASELGKEVGLCLRYYSVTFRGRRPETLTLAGGEAHVPQLARLLTEGTGVKVEDVAAPGGTDVGAIAKLAPERSDLSTWALAMGLALRTGAAQAAQAPPVPPVPPVNRSAA